MLRKDNFGNEIKEGSKEHKIKFNENLQEVNEVESFKKYNNKDENFICHCNLLWGWRFHA